MFKQKHPALTCKDGEREREREKKLLYAFGKKVFFLNYRSWNERLMNPFILHI